MFENQFTIESMTCPSCVEKVTEQIRSLPHLTKIVVSLEKQLIRAFRSVSRFLIIINL